MRSIPLLAAPLLLALALAPPAAGAASVTATLDVDLFSNDHKECDVTVAAGSTLAQLLDEAVATGCIAEWSYETDPEFGSYVTSIDYVPGAVATYWAIYVNGEYGTTGVDATIVEDGFVYTFDYIQWLVPT